MGKAFHLLSYLSKVAVRPGSSLFCKNKACSQLSGSNPLRCLSKQKINLNLTSNTSVSFFLETSNGRMLLHRAAREQQLQHLPLQEVPDHVCGAEANWPVQVWKQNWTGSEGHSLSSNVCQVLIQDPVKKY